MNSRRRIERWALVGLFSLTFLPRALHPVSRPLQWYFRAIQFWEALLHGHFAGTIKSLHPGVTVMWLVGGAEYLVHGVRQALGHDPGSLLDTANRAIIFEVSVGVVVLAIAIALCTVLTWRLLAALFDRKVAWIASLVIALDPFYTANGKVLHLDALLTALMLLAVLFCLRHLRTRRQRDMALCGLFTTLAMLTKSPAIFLLLFVPMMLVIGRGLEVIEALRSNGWRAAVRAVGKSLLLPSLVWLGVAAVALFALWPVLWVKPGDALGRYWRGITKHSEQAHPQSLLFLGEIIDQDPGLLFNVMVLLFKTTFVSLPFFLIGLVGAVKAKREEGVSLLGLALYVAFFVLQMGLASKKAPRYVLPAFVAVDTCAAYGLVLFSRRVGRGMLPRYQKATATGVLLLLVVAHGLGGVLRHPYYGTLYNGLLGGARVGHRVFAPQDQAEGIGQLARYVNEQPDAGEAALAVNFQAMEMPAQYYDGPIAPLTDAGAKYRIFGLSYVIREASIDRWGSQWDVFRYRVPERSVEFDGLTYAWLYQTHTGSVPTSFIQTPASATLDDRIQLVGYTLNKQELLQGESLFLTLALGAVNRKADNFQHFLVNTDKVIHTISD